MFEFAESIQRVAIMAVPFLLAVTCHEVAHGLRPCGSATRPRAWPGA
jgi:hypothetical protein